MLDPDDLGRPTDARVAKATINSTVASSSPRRIQLVPPTTVAFGISRHRTAQARLVQQSQAGLAQLEPRSSIGRLQMKIVAERLKQG